MGKARKHALDANPLVKKTHLHFGAGGEGCKLSVVLSFYISRGNVTYAVAYTEGERSLNRA
jgi:hypothetical protein